MAAFVDISGVLFKAQFIVQGKSKISALHHLKKHSTISVLLLMQAGLWMGDVCQVGDGVIVIKDYNYGCVFRVFEACGD